MINAKWKNVIYGSAVGNSECPKDASNVGLPQNYVARATKKTCWPRATCFCTYCRLERAIMLTKLGNRSAKHVKSSTCLPSWPRPPLRSTCDHDRGARWCQHSRPSPLLPLPPHLTTTKKILQGVLELASEAGNTLNRLS